MGVVNIADWQAHGRVISTMQAEADEGWDCGASLYRDVTVGMLRRYHRMSLDVGRVPSMLGGELFRSRVTGYRVNGLEDMVIFLHDMERCLERLNPVSREMITRMVFKEDSSAETARTLGISRRQVKASYNEALDELAGFLLKAEMLEFREMEYELPPKKRPARETCQQGGAEKRAVSRGN